MKGLEPSQINLLEPKPSASTNSATSTRWSKCDIPHKDITGTYPLSVYIWSKNSNVLGGIRTPDQFIRSELLYPAELPKHKEPPCLCIVERHGRGRTYTKFEPSLPIKQSYQELLRLSSGSSETRTHDLQVKSPILYQLSY